MVLPLWGQLEKAQDDDTTIMEAIAEAIAEHEADPTAHLGSGESLQAHKSDGVIDHPAQSVVLDKTPYQNYEQFLNGLGEQNWSNEDGSWSTNTDTIKSASLFSQNSFIGVGALPHPVGSSYPDADLMYQFRLQLSHGGNTDGSLAFGFTNDVLDGGARMIFVKDSTTWRWQIYSASGLEHSFALSTSNTYTKYYRIFYDSVNEAIVLYEGSTVVSTFETVDWKDYIFNGIQVDMSRSTNNQIAFHLSGWKSTFALDIDI
jgi:hypothetical protein